MRLAFLLALLPLPALAYNEAIHAFITRNALAPDATVLQPPTEADYAAFRKLIDGAPQDAWGFKQYFMLDPSARVHCFEPTPDDVAMPRSRLLELASRWVDDDKRNQRRFLRDPKTHEVIAAPDGSPMPYDPATLDFGSLTGVSSQGHAHYGLVDGPLSDDPEVLKKDPAHFAVPKTAHAYGPEMAELYTDLSLIAARNDMPWLAACFEGNAFHHLEDVANQIHTVQVGIYEFFKAAFIQSKVQDLKTLGGLFGPRKTLEQIGLRLISNHHLMSEDLFAKRVMEKARGGVEMQDPELEKLAPQKIPQGLGLGLAKALIELSSREGPQAYRLAWEFSTPTLHDGVNGHEYDGDKGDDPDKFVDFSHQQALQRFYDLEWRGLRRGADALRIWERGFAERRSEPRAAAVQRISALLVPYHQAAAQRRAAYVPAKEQTARIAWGYPAALVAVVALVVLGARRKLRRRVR